MIGYLGYKILNNLLLRMVSSKQTPLLRSVGVFNGDQRAFYFEFSDATTHFGDRLFFLPLILTLVKNGYTVRLSDRDFVTSELFMKIAGCNQLDSAGYQDGDVVIIPKPSYLRFMQRYPDCVLVDFTDNSVKQGITDQLVVSFQKCFDLNFSLFPEFPVCIGSSKKHSLLDEGGKYWLFSNYINSGRFRKFFVNENKLLEQCKELKNQGYKIIHVGSKHDVQIDNCLYDFVDIDLRGKISIYQLIDLVYNQSVIGAVTYDNFLMHLVGLYRKQAFVLFRGRFSKVQYQHHINSVNNTFFVDISRLKYL